MTLTNAWMGAPSATSVQIVTSTAGGASVRIRYSANADLSSPAHTALLVPDANGIARHTVSGLPAGAVRYWGVEEGGVLGYAAGRLNTLPGSGVRSFTFTFGSCWNETANEADTWSKIAADPGEFFWFTGDLHYDDNNVTDPAPARASFDARLALPGFSDFARTVPMFHTWDDHDFCGNDSDSTAIGKATAGQVYRERVPHLTLPASDGVGIWYTFTLGRCRFIGLDTRSQRVLDGTMLGAEQKAWLQNIIANETLPVTFLMTPSPWVGSQTNTSTSGTWGGDTGSAERRQIAGWVAQSSTEVVILSGDSHHLMGDDGRNSPGGFPVFQAAPLCATTAGGVKGGPYNAGVYRSDAAAVEQRQYGRVTVTDNGGPITIAFSGRDAVGGDVQRIEVSTTVSTSLAHNTVRGSQILAMNRKVAGLAVATSRRPKQAIAVPPTEILEFSDAFNRADAAILGTADLGGAWSEWTNGMQVVANMARHDSEFSCGVFTPPLSSSDQWAEATVGPITTGTSSFLGPFVRGGAVGTSPTSANSFYGLIVSGSALSSFTLRLKSDLAGDLTSISTTAQPIAEGDVIRLEARGDMIYAYLNGILALSYQGAVLTAHNRCGLYCNAGTGMSLSIDSFRAGTLTP